LLTNTIEHKIQNMQMLKGIYEKLGTPILIAYILLFSGPLGNKIVTWGWCTANSPNCKNGYSLAIFLVIITAVGLLAELIKRIFFGEDILKITIVDSSNINSLLDNQYVDNEFRAGITLYAGLNIENKTNEEISKCYGTLEYIEPIFQNNQEWVTESDLKAWKYLNKFPQRILSWKNNGLDKTDYKISIAPKSNHEILRVGQLFLGLDKQTGQSTEFDFSSFTPIQGLHPLGLYKIKIRIDGKIKNGTEDIKPIWFNGWLYSAAIDESSKVSPNAKLESYHLIIRAGDPLKNNSISKRLTP
jgi:hypothetical protein